MKTAPHLYPLHGFLGRPQDWHFLQGPIQATFCPISLDKIASPTAGLQEWGRHFNQQIPLQGSSPNILLGYSLGGRLALHALINSPHLWQAAIIVSAHPGLKTREDKRDRLEHDHRWAQRFLEEPWPALMDSWNSQSIFQGQRMDPRAETDYCRQSLHEQLIGWSLGNQDDLSEAICTLFIPILWVVGERDLPYRQLADTLHLKHPLSKHWCASKVAHRIPWESSSEFINEINQFIHTLREEGHASPTSHALA